MRDSFLFPEYQPPDTSLKVVPILGDQWSSQYLSHPEKQQKHHPGNVLGHKAPGPSNDCQQRHLKDTPPVKCPPSSIISMVAEATLENSEEVFGLGMGLGAECVNLTCHSLGTVPGLFFEIRSLTGTSYSVLGSCSLPSSSHHITAFFFLSDTSAGSQS